MQKTYTVSVYLNLSLSALFIVLITAGFFTTDKIKAEDWGFFIYFVLVFGMFLWLCFSCLKLKKYNAGQISIKTFQRKTGKVVAITAIVFAATLLLAVAAGSMIFRNEATKEQMLFWPLHAIMLFLMMVSAATALLNAVFYFKALKKNRLIVNEYINSIGT